MVYEVDVHFTSEFRILCLLHYFCHVENTVILIKDDLRDTKECVLIALIK